MYDTIFNGFNFCGFKIFGIPFNVHMIQTLTDLKSYDGFNFCGFKIFEIPFNVRMIQTLTDLTFVDLKSLKFRLMYV